MRITDILIGKNFKRWKFWRIHSIFLSFHHVFVAIISNHHETLLPWFWFNVYSPKYLCERGMSNYYYYHYHYHYCYCYYYYSFFGYIILCRDLIWCITVSLPIMIRLSMMSSCLVHNSRIWLKQLTRLRSEEIQLFWKTSSHSGFSSTESDEKT
jgi:hypothetical protein